MARASRLGNLGIMLAKRSDLLTVIKLPGCGRTLISVDDIPCGIAIHEEFPMLLTPPPSRKGHVLCHGCLAPLPWERDLSSALRFCSDGCKNRARKEWLSVYEMCDFDALLSLCEKRGEKYPLMVARVACMILQRHVSTSADRSCWMTDNPASSFDEIAKTTESGKDILKGDAVSDLRYLSYANLSIDQETDEGLGMQSIPEPWMESHRELQQGLEALNGRDSRFSTLIDAFNPKWFASVLSRLHINTFRVDNLIFPTDPSLFLKAAASASQGGLQQGSAVFLLGSLFNHSCVPNIDVRWPENNAHVAFVANTAIPRHTELTISYIDQHQPVALRQHTLAESYGFQCTCMQCREDLEHAKQ